MSLGSLRERTTLPIRRLSSFYRGIQRSRDRCSSQRHPHETLFYSTFPASDTIRFENAASEALISFAHHDVHQSRYISSSRHHYHEALSNRATSPPRCLPLRVRNLGKDSTNRIMASWLPAVIIPVFIWVILVLLLNTLCARTPKMRK